jgi:hypothetical protein
MILKDGRIVTFEVSIEQFNQLRYMVAKVRQHVFITLSCYQCSSSVSKYDINIDESLTTPNIIANYVIFDHILQVLQEMQTLERHPIMKIISEFKKREEEEYNK